MTSPETHLAMAQRHVVAGTDRVARQRAIVVALARQGYDTEAAEALLATMEDTLLLMREHLAIEQAHAGR